MEIKRVNNTIADVYVKNDSYYIDEIGGRNTITLRFLLRDVVEFEIGDYVTFEGNDYKIRYKEKITKEETSLGWQYSITFHGSIYETQDVMFFLGTPSRKKNTDYYNGKASDWLSLFVSNMNRVSSGWTAGTCIESKYVNLSFKDKSVYEVMSDLCKELETELYVKGKTINIGKVSFSSNGLVLGQGEGMGFTELSISAVDETPPVTVLYPYGLDKNLGSDYGSDYLLLPNGAMSISKNVDKYGTVEKSKQFNIYPHGIFTVTSKISDVILQASGIDFNLTDCLLNTDESDVVVTFQDGGLAGYDLNIVAGSWNNTTKQFELKVDSDENALNVPGDINFAVGDKFIITNIKMPQSYITAAETELQTEAQKWLDENCDKKIQLSGKCDDVLFHNKGISVSCGQMVTVFSDHLNINREIRVTAVKKYIENGETSYRYELTLSDFLQSNSFSNLVNDIKNTPETIKKASRQSISFTRRTFQNALETQKMLESAFDGFSKGINPVWIQTMSLLAGDESLQFRFISALPTDRTVLSSTISSVEHTFDYNSDTKVFSTASGVIQHMTIGVRNLSSAHYLSEYKFWSLSAFTYNVSGMGALYVYAKCSKTDETGEFLLSETAIKLEGVDGFYHLLLGTLSVESDGTRSFTELYGFSELTPGRLTIDRIISPDGYQYLDFLAKAARIGGADSYLEYSNKVFKEKGMMVISGSGATDYIEVDRGDYDSTKPYYVGEKVKYLGSYYKNIKDCDAGILPTNTTYWKLLVSAGDTGEAGFSAVLTNEAITLPSNSSGSVTSYSNGSTGIKLYEGSAQLTTGLTYSYSPSAGITLASWSSSSSSVSITGFSASYDNGYIDCTVTYKNISYTKRCVVGKLKQGIKGNDGNPGSDGSSGISYWLASSDSVISDTVTTTTSGKSHSYSPTTIYFYPRKRIGNNDPVAAGDCTLTVRRYYNGTSDTPYSSQYCTSLSYSVSVPSGCTSIVASMYYGNILVDTFTVATVETATSAKDELAKQIGYDSFSSMVSTVQSKGKIIASGGMMSLDLLDAKAVLTQALNVPNYANIVGTMFGVEGVRLAQNSGLTLSGTNASGSSTTLGLTPSTVGSLDNFKNNSGSLSGSTGWEYFSTSSTYYLSATKGNISLSNISKIAYGSFVISGSMTNNTSGVTSFEVYAHLYVCNSSGVLSDMAIGVARVSSQGSFSVTVSSGSVSTPNDATYVYVKAEVIASSSMTSFSLSINTTSFSITSASGAQKSLIGVDGYGIYLDALNYLHWVASDDGLRLSFMGKSYSIKPILFAAKVVSGNVTFANYTGAILDKNISPTISRSGSVYTINHSIYSAFGITQSGTIIQVTALKDNPRSAFVYSSSDNSCNVVTTTVGDGSSVTDTDFYITITSIK